MSSIAYLTDERMLEYHRSSGNRNVNFWRIGVRNFDKFEAGDLLFFVDKRSIHPFTKEKGIIGFGVYREIRTLSVERTWKDYEQLTGYRNKHSFIETVLKMNEDILPERIQSIYLEQVFFFKTPIYIGEFSKPLNRNLESFVYLEDEEEYKLLEKGRNYGIDSWFELMNDPSQMQQEYQTIQNNLLVRQALRNIHVFWTQEQERMIYSIKADKVSRFAYQSIADTSYIIYIPISSMRNQYYEALGMVRELQTLLNYKLTFVFLVKENAQQYERKINQFDFLRLEYI